MLFAGACSSKATENHPTERTAETLVGFECVMANAATGLNRGSTVERARLNLNALIADSSLSAAEITFFQELLTEIEDLDSADLVGDTLDGFCNLR
jgi:hypothetical protein